jgi:hypothetical protein
MAKATSKTPAKKAVKKPAKKAAAKPRTVSPSIEKSCENVLKTLQSLNIDPQLQADLQWCLGSYRADQNPAGLYEMAGRALAVLTEEKKKKTKGVPAKLVNDLEKALAGR